MIQQHLSIDEIFNEALARQQPADRAAYLNAACEGQPALRQRIERLLAAHPQAHSFIEAPAMFGEATELPGADPTVGMQIGPYKLLEQIGEGGMGVVYMAEQQRPVRRLVALKLVKPGMDSKQVIARFEAERQALAVMDHPNIARILEAGVTDTGRPFFVMELVRGIPINEFCDQKKLSVRDRLALFIQVWQAVQHAHQKGIIHRDLKPTNVLVTMHDAIAVPKIIDFGIAKALGQSLTEHTLHTGFAQLIGTPLYMSPEQAEMNQFGVDTRSDVYSLGVMLYELLTGTTPFDKDRLKSAGFDEMRRIICEEEAETISKRLAKTRNAASGVQAPLSPRVPVGTSPPGVDARAKRFAALHELDWIVSRCLEKDRNRRYESASSVAADIQRYLDDEQVQACPPSAAYRFRKFARKHKRALTTAALLVVSLLLGTGISIWQAVRATAAEAQANANEAKATDQEQKALALAQAESAQRQRAEKSERQAKDRLAEAERQRKQAVTNLDAAFEALDRMLVHVSAEELNDVPRVGPLRRKMLKDAIAFYERIPLKSAVSLNSRYRIAQTWDRIARLSWSLDEYEQARTAFNTAIPALSQLAVQEPTKFYFRVALAQSQEAAGKLNQYQFGDYQEAERLFRSSGEIYAGITRERPLEQKWLIRQTDLLNYLSQSLSELGKEEEAVGCLNRALDLLDQAHLADSGKYASVLYQLASIHRATPSKSDELYRRAITLYRSNGTGDKATTQDRISFANILWASAVRSDFGNRQPFEAEKMLDESITLLREACGQYPARRGDAFDLIRALRAQADHLRGRYGLRQGDRGDEQSAEQIKRADKYFQEALERQRQLATRFALTQDQFELARMLQGQGEHLLTETAGTTSERPHDAATMLQADALLTEAIQLCRGLTAEFPDNADYKNRLAALLKLHLQHFVEKDTGQAARPNP